MSEEDKRKVEYYSEKTFEGFNGARRFYTGPGLIVGIGFTIFCFCMSCACQKSPNLSAKWLQRRSGAQIGTFAHLATTSLVYEHDGNAWIVRDWSKVKQDLFGAPRR